jgi:hypothetical protein
MRRTKSTACHEHMVAASSSSSEDDLSLCVDQEEAPAPTCDVASSNMIPQRKSGVPSQRGQFTASMRHIGRMTF